MRALVSAGLIAAHLSSCPSRLWALAELLFFDRQRPTGLAGKARSPPNLTACTALCLRGRATRNRMTIHPLKAEGTSLLQSINTSGANQPGLKQRASSCQPCKRRPRAPEAADVFLWPQCGPAVPLGRAAALKNGLGKTARLSEAGCLRGYILTMAADRDPGAGASCERVRPRTGPLSLAALPPG